ncbi:MAG TPA: anthranilate synthase component I [Longimicrobiales bacterium]|nr:anthranilate synthase component I [Longimicrobiales bacterium]
MISPSFEEFRDWARAGYDLIPVARRFPFDTRTAVTAYANVRESPFGFLLESVVGAEKWARYTFLGSAPREVVRMRAGELSRWTKKSGWQTTPQHTDVLTYLQQRLAGQRVAPVPGLPRFFGGVVGYVGYDVVRSIEHLPNAPVNDLGLPEAVLMFTDVLLAIDNVFGHASAIACVEVPPTADDGVLRTVYDEALHHLDTTIKRLHAVSTLAPLEWNPPADEVTGYTSSWPRADFEAAVEKIRDYIAAGDAFQVVLSQRLAMPLTAPPFELYRGLRALNPSPYLFFLELDDLALVGSSPEVLVRAEQGRVIVRPIAGTRRRGRDDDEDLRLADDLKRDAKERAEHLMLVDLGRNDVGRVARHGSVQLSEFMAIERYSHVLHMVSQVEGELTPGVSAVDVLRACFPAGTVSGAPKVRAMEIIDELEPVARGPYGGAVGYFTYGGAEMDTAIAIRTLVAAGETAYVQAGAGVVADSRPAAEYQETLAKAQALLRVLAGIRRSFQ